MAKVQILIHNMKESLYTFKEFLKPLLVFEDYASSIEVPLEAFYNALTFNP